MLDTARGIGAANMQIDLRRGGELLASVTLDENGRGTLLEKLGIGSHELLFHAGDYFGARTGFFDIIPVHFNVDDAEKHYHVPLILSPFGYSTYRGS